MPLFKQLEQKEELLRKQVHALPENQRKEFYHRQSQKLKDPDTYATLNWFFLNNSLWVKIMDLFQLRHHCY